MGKLLTAHDAAKQLFTTTHKRLNKVGAIREINRKSVMETHGKTKANRTKLRFARVTSREVSQSAPSVELIMFIGHFTDISAFPTKICLFPQKNSLQLCQNLRRKIEGMKRA